MCVFSSFLFSSLLYYFLDFWRKKKHFLLFLHFISLCLNFSSKILLYISSFFLSFKKLVSTLYYTQYVIVLYTIMLLSARRLNFLFLFFHRKKIRTDRPSLLTYIDYLYFISFCWEFGKGRDRQTYFFRARAKHKKC